MSLNSLNSSLYILTYFSMLNKPLGSTKSLCQSLYRSPRSLHSRPVENIMIIQPLLERWCSLPWPLTLRGSLAITTPYLSWRYGPDRLRLAFIRDIIITLGLLYYQLRRIRSYTATCDRISDLYTNNSLH
jgi:hypothetical protein